MNRLAVDIETYSSVDLTKSGVYRYVEAPDFDILLIAYRIDDEEVGQLQLAQGADYCVQKGSKVWKAMKDLLTNPDYIKTAYNANFERTCLAKYFGVPMPPEQWECTMVKAMTMGLPATLATTGEALGLPEDKQKLKTGKALINYFCKPCRPTKSNNGRTRNLPEHHPEKWEQFCDYNRQDVVTETAIRDALDFVRIPDSEHKLWCLDQQINDRGVRLDLEMAENIVRYDERHQAELKARAKQLTGLDNPNSTSQLSNWLEQMGHPLPNLQKATISDALHGELPEEVCEVLRIRQQMSKTSTKKYQAMLDCACDDNRARGLLQFYGASRSGRWAGRLLQVQNLPQNHIEDLSLARQLAATDDFGALELLYGDTSKVLSELVRTAFIPSEGCRFIVSDFSAIEARVIAWLAGEEWRLKVFREGGDIYCTSASRIYGVPVEKHGINGHLRQRGKVAELACGYQGGVGAMKRMDTTGTVPEEEMQQIVDDWRKASPKIVRLWRKLERAAKETIETGRQRIYSIKYYDPDQATYNEEITGGEGYSPWFRVDKGNEMKFMIKHKNGLRFLLIRLPSGRFISYADPQLEESEYGPKITYMGVNQTTRKWERTDTYGGKLVENCVQAIARDCLALAMQRVTKAGYNIIMHVHDEMIVDVPREDDKALDRINAIMAEPVPWAPGLPLVGDSYETDFYRKD